MVGPNVARPCGVVAVEIPAPKCSVALRRVTIAKWVADVDLGRASWAADPGELPDPRRVVDLKQIPVPICAAVPDEVPVATCVAEVGKVPGAAQSPVRGVPVRLDRSCPRILPKASGLL